MAVSPGIKLFLGQLEKWIALIDMQASLDEVGCLPERYPEYAEYLSAFPTFLI